MTDRYRMEYINCEVSAIYDDYEKTELVAEELTDRLNKLTKENEQLQHLKEAYGTEIVNIKHTIKTMMENERTEIGKNTLKQLWEAIQ